MTGRDLEEYKALRATIRERGSLRVWLFVAGLVAWGALTLATAALAALPVSTLLPLLILTATFEAVFSLHIGVERVGRYVQLFLEEDAGWEHVAMTFGRPARGSATDPLFTPYFVFAALLNFVPVLLAEPVPIEVGVVGTVHGLVIVRMFVGRWAATRQRALDLERFRQIKPGSPSAGH
jgi:hypothetical protein